MEPLFYWRGAGRLAFASELKDLFSVLPATPGPDSIAFSSWLGDGIVPRGPHAVRRRGPPAPGLADRARPQGVRAAPVLAAALPGNSERDAGRAGRGPAGRARALGRAQALAATVGRGAQRWPRLVDRHRYSLRPARAWHAAADLLGGVPRQVVRRGLEGSAPDRVPRDRAGGLRGRAPGRPVARAEARPAVGPAANRRRRCVRERDGERGSTRGRRGRAGRANR